MNKWWWLFLVVVGWIGVGIAMFGLSGAHNGVGSGRQGKTSRIVSMAPNLTEILFALGLGEMVVGVSNDSDYPPEAAERKRVGTFWQPSIEAVIAAKPDLVVVLGFGRQRSLAQRLKRIGYKVLTVNIETVGDLFEGIKQVGEATGRRAEAEALAGDIKKRLDDLAALAGTAGRVRALYVVQREPLRVAGRDTFINEMIELAGGENVIGPTVQKYPPIGTEQLIACSPEVIVEPLMLQKSLIDQQDSAADYWSRFENIPAVRNGRIYVIDGDTVSRLGPRLHEGAEQIARCLRPELFTD